MKIPSEVTGISQPKHTTFDRSVKIEDLCMMFSHLVLLPIRIVQLYKYIRQSLTECRYHRDPKKFSTINVTYRCLAQTDAQIPLPQCNQTGING